VVEVGPARAALVNGVLGDPLLHVRLRQRRRSLLFDLGDARLPARLAHQISDVFVSHAHLDHIGGFPWLLRARMGVAAACRLYGPPGLAGHLQGFLDGVRWDRIGGAGPRFRVTELQGERVLRFRLQAGRRGPMPEGEAPAGDGLLLEEPGLRVRAATLDHGIPVLAYALEFPRTFHVRKERLAALGLPPGPWLSALKDALARDAADTPVALPDGSTRPAGALGRELVITAPGQTLAYATDFADMEANRRTLAALARGARVLLCESTFLVADAERAAATGHLTTRACAAIAEAAGVERLVPFHFSRRYESAPERVYEELAAFTSRLSRPPARS
jgi:ribonuclease BN (tRNA processing enzyme)